MSGVRARANLSTHNRTTISCENHVTALVLAQPTVFFSSVHFLFVAFVISFIHLFMNGAK